MSVGKEFRDFIAKGNVIDLAVAVVLGAAFGKIVTAIVEGLIMPLVGAVLPQGGWRDWTVTGLNLEVGRVLSATVDFVIIGLVLFLVVKKLLASVKKSEVKPAPPATKDCPECLEKIPAQAKRCKFCTSVQPS